MIRRFLVALAIVGLSAGCGDGGPARGDSSTDSRGPSTDEVAEVSEQAVIVHIRLTDDGFGTDAERERIFELEDRLVDAIDDAGVGEFDGNEFGAGEVVMFAYGADADALFAVMAPALREFHPAKGSYAIKRYGDAEDSATSEVRVSLD